MPFKDKEKARIYNKSYHAKTWQSRKENHQKLKQKRRTNLALWLKEYKK